MDAFSLVIIVVVAGSFLYAGYNIWRTKKHGIETDAFVTRIEERESHDSDGTTWNAGTVFFVPPRRSYGMSPVSVYV